MNKKTVPKKKKPIKKEEENKISEKLIKSTMDEVQRMIDELHKIGIKKSGNKNNSPLIENLTFNELASLHSGIMIQLGQYIQQLYDWGFADNNGILIEDLSYEDLMEFYTEKYDFMERQKKVYNTQEYIEEKIINTSNMTPLEAMRAQLMPKILDLMKRLKGRSNATHEEIGEMFDYYNQYYLRNDSPSCSICVARVYEAFKNLTKGQI